MRAYKQLTEEDRIAIYAMKQAGKQQNPWIRFMITFKQKYYKKSNNLVHGILNPLK